MNTPESRREAVARALAQHYEELARFVSRRAGGALLRQEPSEDLVQGLGAHALAHAGAGEPPRDVRAWLLGVAENYLHDRRDYWNALKRSGSGLLRAGLAEAAAPEVTAALEPAASVTGPSTFAARREQIELLAAAMDLLLPRDRELVRGLGEGLSVEEQAGALGLSYDAALQARLRALARLRGCYQAVVGARRPG